MAQKHAGHVTGIFGNFRILLSICEMVLRTNYGPRVFVLVSGARTPENNTNSWLRLRGFQTPPGPFRSVSVCGESSTTSILPNTVGGWNSPELLLDDAAFLKHIQLIRPEKADHVVTGVFSLLPRSKGKCIPFSESVP